jgi:hypothetical protein
MPMGASTVSYSLTLIFVLHTLSLCTSFIFCTYIPTPCCILCACIYAWLYYMYLYFIICKLCIMLVFIWIWYLTCVNDARSVILDSRMVSYRFIDQPHVPIWNQCCPPVCTSWISEEPPEDEQEMLIYTDLNDSAGLKGAPFPAFPPL